MKVTGCHGIWIIQLIEENQIGSVNVLNYVHVGSS